jgi:hypothetical protein
MTNQYTGDFYSKLNATGRQHEWSQADIDLAKQHPSFKSSMVTLKDQWHSDRDNRDAIHQTANDLRSSYGGRTATPDGSGSISNGYYDGQRRSAEQQISAATQNPYNYTAWTNPYDNKQNALLDQVVNRSPFSYDKNTDPQWSAYSKQYRREGERATANALAQASAATGGRPSSFAMTAASQAGDYYATRLNDKLPELYRQAYERYMQEFLMNRQALGDVNAMAGRDYDQWYRSAQLDRSVHDGHIANLRANQSMWDRQHQWDAGQRQPLPGGVSQGPRTDDDFVRHMLSLGDEEAALRWLMAQDIDMQDVGRYFSLYNRMR